MTPDDVPILDHADPWPGDLPEALAVRLEAVAVGLSAGCILAALLAPYL